MSPAAWQAEDMVDHLQRAGWVVEHPDFSWLDDEDRITLQATTTVEGVGYALQADFLPGRDAGARFRIATAEPVAADA